ncbi:MAG TPA: hypothetical protein VF607_17460, partial [Verrucomicrobiae bacterium]
SPVAITLPAWNITGGNAKLSGKVTPQGAAASVFFEWGETANYGHFTATNTIASNLNTEQQVTMGITGMTPGVTNHYRVVAYNGIGLTAGQDVPIPPYPTMGAAKSAGSVLIYWPTNYPGYFVQSTTNLLAPIHWSADPGSIGIGGGYYILTNPAPAGQKYYRVVQ